MDKVEPIRVLQVFSGMNIGGAESMIMNYYRQINRSKVQFDFIVHTMEHCAFDDEIKKMGGKIYHIPKYKGYNHFQYIKAWKEFFNSHEEYKIIHGHVRSTGAIYLKVAKKFGLFTIAHSHSTSSGKGISAFVKNIIQKGIVYETNSFFACSKQAGEWLFGKKIVRQDNFHIIKNAIKAENYIFAKETQERVRRSLGLTQKEFIIGHIGRFSYPKNHDFIIEVFREIQKKNKKSILLLIGDGELRKTVEKKVNCLKLNENVIFCGIRSDVAELLQAMSVFIFPSYFEGLPVTLVEAQAAGLKCFISDVITNEVIITSLVKKIPLKESAEIWASAILKEKNGNFRRNEFKSILDSGYNINKNVEWIENFYICCRN